MQMILTSAVPVLAGDCRAEAIACKESLSFWGGVDAHTGCIIDERHDYCGTCMSGKVLCIPRGRGSCSSSGILLEMIRSRTAPAAILAVEIEPVLSLGSVIGRETYGRYIPIYQVSAEDYQKIKTGFEISIQNNIIGIDAAES